MSDVLFITPNIEGNISEEPLGTLLLGTILRNSGISVDILQFSVFGTTDDFPAFLKRAITCVEERQPKIVSFYTRCADYHVALTLAREIKKNSPDIWIVLGGPQADITAEDTVREIDWIDFVCRGEGETTVVPLFTSLLNNTPDLTVAGLAYKDGERVVMNPKPPQIEDLDALPMIDWSLCLCKGGLKRNRVAELFPVDVGRGCPFACTYCSTKSFWGRRYRLKSPERIVREIKDVHETFGVTDFMFVHDMFTMKRSLVIETCRLLKELDFPINWWCSARLDCLDEELIDIMADAGFKSVFIGIETGSPRMQKLIDKNLKLERTIPILNYLTKKGLRATTSFMYGFPQETEEDIAQTIGLIARICEFRNVDIQAHLCVFLPGTELTDTYRSEMEPFDGYADFNNSLALAECADLIREHPAIFQNHLEYRTPLRTRMQYLTLFVKLWRTASPVYRFLSEEYGEDNLLHMYYDFVSANEELLEQIKKLPMYEQICRLLQEDHFIERYKDEEYYDIIKDIYRLRAAQAGLAVEGGGTLTDVYCFSPSDLNKVSDLRLIKRRVTMVKSLVCADGSVKYQIFDRKK